MRSILAAVLLVTAGCPSDGGKTCGVPGDAGAGSLGMTAEGTTFVYGDFGAGHARDCGEESTTIDGVQIEPAPAGFHLTLCVPRGDRIGSGALDLSDPATVDLVDASGQAGECIYSIDFDQTPSGTVRFEGYCDEGGASFLMTLDGSVGGFETCTPAGGGEPVQTATTLTLAGSAVVAFPPQ